MSEIPLEKMLPRAGGSVYRLVRMASKRALELADGKKFLLDTVRTDKVISIAFEEIASGRVVASTVKEQLAAPQEDTPKDNGSGETVQDQEASLE